MPGSAGMLRAAITCACVCLVLMLMAGCGYAIELVGEAGESGTRTASEIRQVDWGTELAGTWACRPTADSFSLVVEATTQWGPVGYATVNSETVVDCPERDDEFGEFQILDAAETPETDEELQGKVEIIVVVHARNCEWEVAIAAK